ncbi:MAG: hypothetical protein KatS3mg056_3298 [Chloroflexus sp.]|nr:MAG: hypothetical protein KatS3mg056_3298 [Chloroflexus sp.]
MGDYADERGYARIGRILVDSAPPPPLRVDPSPSRVSAFLITRAYSRLSRMPTEQRGWGGYSWIAHLLPPPRRSASFACIRVPHHPCILPTEPDAHGTTRMGRILVDSAPPPPPPRRSASFACIRVPPHPCLLPDAPDAPGTTRLGRILVDSVPPHPPPRRSASFACIHVPHHPCILPTEPDAHGATRMGRILVDSAPPPPSASIRVLRVYPRSASLIATRTNLGCLLLFPLFANHQHFVL